MNSIRPGSAGTFLRIRKIGSGDLCLRQLRVSSDAQEMLPTIGDLVAPFELICSCFNSFVDDFTGVTVNGEMHPVAGLALDLKFAQRIR